MDLVHPQTFLRGAVSVMEPALLTAPCCCRGPSSCSRGPLISADLRRALPEAAGANALFYYSPAGPQRRKYEPPRPRAQLRFTFRWLWSQLLLTSSHGGKPWNLLECSHFERAEFRDLAGYDESALELRKRICRRHPFSFVGPRFVCKALYAAVPQAGVALSMVSPTMKALVDVFWVVWSIGASIYDYLNTSAMEERIHTLENTITFHQCVIGLLTVGLALLFTYILLRKR
ncbi:hypothetical protein COCON_G00210310 [Conger conger]|uniref:Uncharacterized protein n=1 Tax=Conger conger TaxID=82655 RepID=A0A9Q1D0D4_CONCO|nr:hypothetical protein COCON_G00210310 [Conger conger]